MGQGLAGSLLAWELARRGERLLVVDPLDDSAASRTAAGLLNPVTGRRLAMTPGLAHLLPAARGLYDELAGHFGRPFFHPRPLRRLFRDEAERLAWNLRLTEPGYRDYLEPPLPPGPDGVHDPFGSGPQRHTGFLDTVALLDALAGWLRDSGRLLPGRVDAAALRLEEEAVEWNGLRARRVIFCEGWRVRDNPWFRWLPLQPAKGEILTLAAHGPIPPDILNAGRWLLPLDQRHLRLGATYQWRPLDQTATAAGRDALLADLPALLATPPPVTVIGHRAGVRAGTRDRQPFLGLHPRESRLGIFNGLGSKATLLAPWHAARLADFLTDRGALPSTADIRRYWHDG